MTHSGSRRCTAAHETVDRARSEAIPVSTAIISGTAIRSRHWRSAESMVASSCRAPWRGLTAIHCSEIRLVRSRHRGVPSGIIFVPVFGADIFRPFAQGAPISYDRRPRHSEDAFILDRKLELQSFALIVGVDSPLGHAAILFFTSFLRFFRGFEIKQTITLHHMQSLGVRRAETVDHRKRPDLDPHGVYYQRVAFVMADGISIP